ncbi:MAG: ATP-binding protein [Anaerolineae bacterium]|nr:ATP-binding protein [Anaerolineae bacterium]
MDYDKVVQLELPAEHKYLNIVSACIGAMMERIENVSQPEITTYNIQLAVQEACTNIVRHAYKGQSGGRIEVTMTLEDKQRFIIDLADAGKSFVLPKDIDINLNEPNIHGYGLFLMHQLLDEVDYKSDQNNNYWHLVKNLQ